MSTVDKALSVLDLFSESQPNLGLSEIARQLGWDKSNVQRYLADLTRHGLLEQSARDKTYFLGPSLTRLSMMRAVTHPTASEVRAALQDLSENTGETAHANALIGGLIRTTDVVATKIKGTRVYIDPAEPLPLHASASGIAYLSALPEEKANDHLGGALKRYTAATLTDRAAVLSQVRTARTAGYAKAHGTYESDVVGLAAPVLGFNGAPIGAVAVAVPASRFLEGKEARISAQVIDTAKRVSKLHGAA